MLNIITNTNQIKPKYKPCIPEFHRQLLALAHIGIEAEFVGALNQHVESITPVSVSSRRMARTNAEKPAWMVYQEPLDGLLRQSLATP